jgi:uncharacterized protein YbjT (DUF2867 family)
MTRVLVTGGTGGLGSEVVNKLIKAGYQVRVMSRHNRQPGQWPEAEWAQADLAIGTGLSEAVAGVDAIIHAATNAGVTLEDATLSTFISKALLRHDGSVDVQGTRLLLDYARNAGVGHFIYISIVGVEQIPFAYYRHKLQAETLIQDSTVPWSIARATQFHSLINGMIEQAAKGPVMMLPTDFQFQPVDPRNVAEYLCACISQGPAGRLPNFGGPEVHTLGDMARTWQKILGKKKPIIRVPLPGKTAKTLRQGGLTSPNEKHGTITWEEWLRQTSTRSKAKTTDTSVSKHEVTFDEAH